MNNRRALLAALILLTTVLACAVPGLPTASQPAPTADTRLEIMVAETVAAALEQTQQAAPTPTLVPTATSTPRPTATPTATSIAAGNDSGSTLTKLDDGSTLFTDDLANYEMTVPSGWLAVRINSQEYLDAWLLPELTNPAMQRSLSSIENMDPNQLRLFALDIQDGHAEVNFITNINFYWDAANDMSLANDEDLKAEAASLPQALSGLEVIAAELSATVSGIPLGVITSKTPITTVEGVSIEIFQKQIFIKVNSGVSIITLSTTEELKQEVLPQFDAMIETLKVEK